MNTEQPAKSLLDRLIEQADGEAMSADEARETRRARRLVSLENLRNGCEEAVKRLVDGTAGRLPYDEQEIFERVKDPYLAIERMARSVRRIVALEDRLDESAEARAARLAAEAAARANAERDAEAWAAGQPERDKKKLIRRAVRTAYQDGEPDLDHREREDLLNDLFNDYDEIDDYDGDPAEIVARFCAQLRLSPAVVPLDGDEDEPPEQAKARAVAFARGYLDLLAPQGAANRNSAEPAPADKPAPRAKGRSPPG